jgi:hypothetical protein
MLQVYGYAIVGLISLVLGDRLARRHETDGDENLIPQALPARGVTAAVIVGMCLTLGAVSVLVARFGSVVFTDPSFIAVRGTFGLFWLYPLMHAAVYAWAFVPANQWASGQPARRAHIAALMGVAAVVYAVTSSKAILVIAMLLLVVTYHRVKNPVRVSVLLGLAAAFLLALPLLYLHRQSGFTLEALTHLTPTMAFAGAQIFLGRAYLADSFGAVLLYTPRVYPFRLGSNWLELFYFWIPRSIWPEKPLSLSLEFGNTYLSSHFERRESYFSPTLLGDAYMNFGGFGIVIVYFVLGYLLRRWYRWAYGPSARPETIVLYAISAYTIGVGAEQSLAVDATLAISYLGVGALLAAIARYGPVYFSRSS